MDSYAPNLEKNGFAAPTLQPDRIHIIDAMRGFALCGILIMNIPYFALPFQQGYDPRIFGELGQRANHFWWAFVNYFLEGSMRGLFSLLFGAGALLLLGRLQKKNTGLVPADIYFRRLLWLLLFGFINGFLLNWPGDILYHYAIVGMFIFAFRSASPKLLTILVALFVGITMLFSFLQKRDLYEMRSKGIEALKLKKQGSTLTEEQEAAIGAWEGFNKKRDTTLNRKEAEKMIKEISEGSYAKVFGEMSRWTVKLESIKFYGPFFFDIIIFFLLGMLLLKTGIISGEKPLAFYGFMAIAGYLLGFGEGYLHYNLVLKSNFDPFIYYRMMPIPADLYQIHRICTTLGHLGLLMALHKSGFFNWLLRPLACMGQMAFTNYLSQSIICGLLFYGYGFGFFGKYERFEIYYFWAAIIAFQMVFSVLWLKYFRFGPFEWAWRSLTYLQWQPLRKGLAEVGMP